MTPLKLAQTVFAVLLIVTLNAARVSAQTTYCPDANPNDKVPDNDALQACLDGGGTILLSPGYPGYILEYGLRLRVSGTVLSSADINSRATIVASPWLNEFMLRTSVDNYEISFLIFDGNRVNRTNACVYPNGENIIASGYGFAIRFVDSINARCGSALEITGAYFNVYNNTFAWNGFSADERNQEWSDGVTVHRCNGGTVSYNQIINNTDVGLVIEEGPNCTIRYNTIVNDARYAFAGIHVSAGYSGGDHSGGSYTGNTISSGLNLMGMGLALGAANWFPGTRTANLGDVTNNSINGAVVNIGVDGVDGGNVVGNTPMNAQGTRGIFSCYRQPPDNYIAWDSAGANLQPGWVTRTCQP